MKKFSLLKKICLALLLLLLLPPATATASERSSAGGVPATVLLAIGFGEHFNDEKFININGLGAIGIMEFFASDVWLTGGLYTNLTFIGELVDKDKVADAGTNPTEAPPEGWGISPGLVLGFTIGTIPYVDIHLLGTIGPSFALLTRYKFRNAAETTNPNVRVKTDELDGQIGYDYGGVAAIAYTGSNPWLRGLTLGLEGGYHENTFDRWHLGIAIGFSF